MILFNLIIKPQDKVVILLSSGYNDKKIKIKKKNNKQIYNAKEKILANKKFF